MRTLLLIALLSSALVWAQDSSSTPPAPATSNSADSAAQTSTSRPPNQPPRSDSVRADDLGQSDGSSSSKDRRVDLSPPADDDNAHPQSTQAVLDAELGGGTAEDYPWNPHKAAKDVEVGDFYFKRHNFSAAESRYREALLYKPNDAIATYKLAISLEKLNEFDAAKKEYQSYLQILPHGPESEDAKKAITRLSTAAEKGPAPGKPTQ